MSSNQTVYVVDADSTISKALTELLGTYDIEVRAFRDPNEFLATLAEEPYRERCLLLDEAMAGGEDLTHIRSLREQNFTFPILLLVNEDTTEVRSRARALGVANVLTREHMANYLIDRLAQVLPSDGRTPTFAQIPLGNGTTVRFRTMEPEDQAIEQAFVRGLSAESRYLRFFSGLKELPPKLLHQLTHNSYPNSYAVIATVNEAEGEKQIGVARYSPTEEAGTVEFAVVIADDWQGHGIARHLLTTVIAAAVMAGQQRIEGLVLRKNKRMLGLARDLGFKTVPGDDDYSIVRVAKDLTGDQIPRPPGITPTSSA